MNVSLRANARDAGSDKCPNRGFVSQKPQLRSHLLIVPLALSLKLTTNIVPGKWNNFEGRRDLFHFGIGLGLKSRAEQQEGFQHLQRFVGESAVHFQFLAMGRQ
jgi:hypothetical protein